MNDEDALQYYLDTQNVSYFNLLYDRYTNKVFAKCISMLRSQELAEDATQEIFVKILLSMSKFSGKSKFSTWLFSITYNHCIDQIRKEKKENFIAINEISNIDQIDDTLHDSEIKETNVYRLKDVMEKLSIEDKCILLMKYQDDMSIKEICKILDKTESAVKMKIMRAKEKFLKKYGDEFGEIAS